QCWSQFFGQCIRCRAAPIMAVWPKEHLMSRKRRNHASSFKAKVALAAVKEDRTLAELAKQFDVHPNQVTAWKRQLLDNASATFESAARAADHDAKIAELYAKIGELTVERDFLEDRKSTRLNSSHVSIS